MLETCWRCRPGSSPATGPRQSAGDRLSAPPDVGPGCSSAPTAWGSSCKAWRWTLEDDTEADPLRSHCNTGRCSCARSVPIWSFSKGSSISFRLASRRMSVQIYKQVRIDVNDHKRAAFLCVSSFCRSPCEQSLPNWPGWTDSRCPPYGCTSVRSPGRTCHIGDKRIRATSQIKHTSE